MSSKQCTWRCSDHIVAVLFLFLIYSHTFSMDYLYKMYADWKYINEKKDADILSLDELLPPPPKQAIPEIVECDDVLTDYALVPEMSAEQKKNYSARGKTWQELMEVFEDAPEGMKDIVAHLIKPLDPEWRAALLVGPPGTGKTTATLAVPHLARWYWKFLSGPELAGQYRNEAKERLAFELKNIISQKKKVVVIIDELNKLLENFNSKGHDTDITASFLWTFLDEQKRNPNFFFIGTMNRDDKIPDPVKHRFGGSTIFFPAIEDHQKLINIFRKVIARNPDLEFSTACTDLFLQKCFDSLKEDGINITPRDYENIRLQIARLTAREDKVNKVRKIRQRHVTEAITKVAKTYTGSGLGKEQLSDEEWRDFNAVQNRIIEIRLNSTLTMQKSLGITGILPTASLGGGMKFDMYEAQKVIEQEFSSDQIALYRRAMKLKQEDNIFMRRTKPTTKR